MEAPTPGRLTRRVVWVERLTAPLAARLWLRARLGAEVRYDPRDATPTGLKLLRLLLAAAAAPVREVELTYARRGPDGGALCEDREARLEAALSAFADSALPGNDAPLRRALVAYLAMELYERTTFVAMAEAAAAEERDAAHELLARAHPAFGLYAPRVGTVRPAPAPGAAFKTLARPLFVWLRALVAALLRPAVSTDLDGTRAGAWVEYYPDDVDGYISRAFWTKTLPPDADRVFYADARGVPWGPEEARRVAAAGFRSIDARKPWTLGPVGLGELLALLPRLVAGPGPWWVRAWRFEHALWTAIWTAAFRRWRVRMLSQFQDFDWRQDCQARALEAAGGVFVDFHWAEAPFALEPGHLTASHAYLAWGANQARRLKAKDGLARPVVPVGAWIVPHAGTVARLRAARGRSKFALALFDTSASDRIFLSPRQLSDFLAAVLERALARPGWAVILKPKGESSYARLPDGARIESALAALRGQGRLVACERLVSPASAGLAADIAVGIGINSAGVLVGAFGGRCVHWNAAGLARHPLVRDGSETVVFEELPALLAALDRAADGDRTAGDFSRWARLINHFGDESGPARAAAWAEGAWKELSSKKSPADAVARANAAHRAREGVPADFPGRAGWWTLGAQLPPGGAVPRRA